MRVLMLGWEFPPFITGGLGTACYGLTKALSRQGTEILFVLPKAVGGELPHDTPVRLLSQQSPSAASGDRAPQAVASTYDYRPQIPQRDSRAFEHVTFKAVPARFSNPYTAPGVEIQKHVTQTSADVGPDGSDRRPFNGGNEPISVLGHSPAPVSMPGDYSGDLIAESRRYAALCVDLACGHQFDVIHAHDWLTFPAGMAVAAAHGKPLIVHVHSTEIDRCGDHVHQAIYDVERRGMHAAMRVIAVSHLTKSIIVNRYGVDPDMVEVIYNGIDHDHAQVPGAPATITINPGDKVVLFLGRITMQKGPEFFIAAAKKVLQKMDNVKFIMAGSGDKVRDVIEMAAREGIGHKVTFTGFVRGDDLDKVFRMADVFVMPSVSEPFGLAALEAVSHDVPVIMSRTSGAAEVLHHTLKVDFWDVNEIANKIIAVLRHPSLGETLRHNAELELRNLTWDGAAEKCLDVYRKAIASMPT